MGLDDSGIICCTFQYLQYKYGKRDTCHASYGSQYHTFRKDLLQNIFGTGTDGTPYAYFRSAFFTVTIMILDTPIAPANKVPKPTIR